MLNLTWIDVSHALVLSYYLLNNKICLKQLEYPLGGSSKKGSHIYFLL